MTTADDFKAAKKSAISAAMDIAEAVSENRLDATQLDRAAADAVRELAGTVAGPGDPLWELHVEIARQVLAVGGGIPAGELAEWLAVTRAAEGAEPVAPEPSWIERALAEGADDEEELAGD